MARSRPAFAASDEPSAPFWMATFSDMMTLLLAFFVMIVAMSAVEVKKFEEALSYFTGRTGLMQEEGFMPGVISVSADMKQQSEQFERLARDLHEMGVADAVDLDLTDAGIRVTFVDSIAFASGSVVLDAPARRLLERVAELSESAREVRVEGHTDDIPISTAAYPSNWELSAARAASVVRYLAAQPGALSAERYVAAGYGEHRPRASNETPAGRSRNRRITVLFQTSDGASDSIAPPLPLQTDGR